MAAQTMLMRTTGLVARPTTTSRSTASPFLPQIRRANAPLVGKSTPVVCAAAAVPAPAPAPAPVPGYLPPPTTYQKYVELGVGKAKLSPMKTLIMGIVGGCYISFGALLALSVGGMCPGILSANPGLQKIVLGSFGLPFGLMLVMNCGAELFTGNTALVTAAVFEGKATTGQLIKNWVCSFTGNLIGAIIMVTMLGISGIGINSAAVNVATAKTSLPFMQAFVRGIFANWLVCLAVFMATAATTLPGRLLGVWVCISSFVAMGFEHSVANMFFIPWGGPEAGISFGHFLSSNLIPVTLGNIVGGAICVALTSSFFFGKNGNGK